MKKKQLTPDEIAEKEFIKKQNSAIRRLTTKVKTDCKENGLNTVRLKLEFLRNNETQLPFSILDKEKTIECFTAGIKLYEEGLQNG